MGTLSHIKSQAARPSTQYPCEQNILFAWKFCGNPRSAGFHSRFLRMEHFVRIEVPPVVRPLLRTRRATRSHAQKVSVAAEEEDLYVGIFVGAGTLLRMVRR